MNVQTDSNRQTDLQTDRWTDIQTDKEIDRQADRYLDRPAARRIVRLDEGNTSQLADKQCTFRPLSNDRFRLYTFSSACQVTDARLTL